MPSTPPDARSPDTTGIGVSNGVDGGEAVFGVNHAGPAGLGQHHSLSRGGDVREGGGLHIIITQDAGRGMYSPR